MDNYDVYVISAGRWNSLPFGEREKSEWIFCVKGGEGDLYREWGCKRVVETGKLIPSRNWALDDAERNGKICVQLSDDIVGVRTNGNFYPKRDCDLGEVIREGVDYFSRVEKSKLMGIAPTNNDFFAKEEISMRTFCIGDLFWAKPCGVRFDEGMTLKEDYDYTLEHLKEFGICFRWQKYIFQFKHYDNKGGAVSYRNDEEEEKNIAHLIRKWGDCIRLNPRRKNEILIKWSDKKRKKP